MKTNALLLLILLLLGFVCENKKITDQKEVFCKQKAIPARAIQFEYRKHIYIHELVDSIEGDFVFDTGAHTFYNDSSYYAQNSF